MTADDTAATVRAGDRFLNPRGVDRRISELDASSVPPVRRCLIDVARRGDTITYGDLRKATGLPHPPNGMGRVLDVVAEDCRRRDEPSLDALVVKASSGEVGEKFSGDAARIRNTLQAYWSTR